MNGRACPHCQADNSPEAAYCKQCGKALPPPVPTGPRIIEGASLAQPQAGQRLQTE
jgi:predicted amidophosphoribosyltransferase